MTKIEWVRNTDGSDGLSWNALRAVRIDENGKRRSANHCEHVNEACRFCYADRGNARLGGLPFKPGHRKDYTFEIDEKKLLEPLRRKKPTRIFVESMSDAFGEWWPDHFIDKLYAVMALCPQHTFINLSKRPERRRAYLSAQRVLQINGAIWSFLGTPYGSKIHHGGGWQCSMPLPNVIEGTSASNQDEANEFGNILFRTLAACRVLSLEPMLGPIVLRDIPTDGVGSAAGNKLSDVLHGIFVGGESGPKARPMHPQWPRDLRDECKAAGVEFFFKQWGQWSPKQPPHFCRLSRNKYSHETFGFLPDGRVYDARKPDMLLDGGYALLYRQAKESAGRLLDGQEHNGFPVINAG